MKNDDHAWIDELGAAVTVTDADGTIVAMNRRACETFAADGGALLIGRSVFACHPERAKDAVRALYQHQRPNHYTIHKKGQWKIVHQMPWYRDGVFAGVVEFTVPIPETLPHFDRG